MGDLLEKRDQQEKGDETNSWWKNLFEKKFDGHVPYWAKEGHQDVNMNWQWGHSHTSSHTSSHTHTKTVKTVRGGDSESSDSESSESSSEPQRAMNPMDMGMPPLIKKHSLII